MYFGLADAHSQNEKKKKRKEDFLLGIAAHLLFGLVWLRLVIFFWVEVDWTELAGGCVE